MAASAIPVAGKRPRKTVLVTANKGGVGKTTTCLHLASAAAREGKKVTVIDLDPQRSLSMWVGQRREQPIAEIGLVEASSDSYQNALVRAADSDLIVIDTKPGIVGDGMSAIHGLARTSDIVLIPTSLSTFDLQQVIPYARALRDATGKYPSFILNRIRHTASGAEIGQVQDALQSYGKVAPRFIRNLVDIERYAADGLSVLDADKAGADDIVNLWSFVKKEVELD